MTEIALRAEHLSKRYWINRQRERYQTLRESAVNTLSALVRALYPWRRRADGARRAQTDFWALRDVSFDVRVGEVVGVIGRNGAGKSTLLKILSRITEPTEGSAELRGRVGSLLEVGTGFHPELTGRDNTYLSGAILGMRRTEIDRKFDEIVEFAGVAKFIDTPVKRYSSGMYLRLAFSVAAHLDPEILLIDEVLAVGDAEFQKKCLGKMGDVAAHGRTVLFVSHNLGAVKDLCHTALVLAAGEVAFRGPVVPAITAYGKSLGERSAGAGSGGVTWESVAINGGSGLGAAAIAGEDPITVDACLQAGECFESAFLFCTIDDALGGLVIHQQIELRDLRPLPLEPGSYHLRIELPALWLAPGVYTLFTKFIGITTGGVQYHRWSDPVPLEVTGRTVGLRNALLAPRADWAVTSESDLPHAAAAASVGGAD